MKCAEAREMLPAYMDEPHGSLPLRRHLVTCADCKTELRHYEAMSAGLQDLIAVTAEPSAILRRQLSAIPSESNKVESIRTHLARNRRAYVSGAAVVLAGAAGAAAWRLRRRVATA
jgi:anti-sigma factor RsiW